MKKKTLEVKPSYLPFVNGLTALTLGVSGYKYEDENFIYNVNGYSSNPDIKADMSFHTVSQEKYKSDIDNTMRYNLIVPLFASMKDAQEDLVLERLNKNEFVLPIPSVRYYGSPMDKTFLEHCAELDAKIEQMKHPEHVGRIAGKRIYVLRPNNATHSLGAFVVSDPTLFRFTLFDGIIRDLNKLWKLKEEGKGTSEFEKYIADQMQHCGLYAVSKNMFGLHGVYSNKMDEAKGGSWLLTPFIIGDDVRVMNLAGELWSHPGSDSQESYAIQVNPKPVSTIVVEQAENELHELFDNPCTHLGGVADFRAVGNYLYFVEMSFSCMNEYYSEEFNCYMVKRVLSKLGKEYIKEIGILNDNQEARYKAKLGEQKEAKIRLSPKEVEANGNV